MACREARSDCLNAIERLLLYDSGIKRAVILTYNETGCPTGHAFLLQHESEGNIFVKSGFSSGYAGQGSGGLSHALIMLLWFRIDIDEVFIDEDMFHRIDSSSLRLGDIDRIIATRNPRPSRFWDYIDQQDSKMFYSNQGNPWRRRSAIIPLAIIDDRLSDLALFFWHDPDISLLKGYRRLEILVRVKAKLEYCEIGQQGATKLYVAAFSGNKSVLDWPGISASEKQGRTSLFIGMAMEHRNSRSHTETAGDAHDQLSEFLLLNHLYLLEDQSRRRSDTA